MTWREARLWCQTHYTDLVVIQNQEENNHLVTVLSDRTASPYYWIGIKRTLESEIWSWVGDNSTWIGNQSWAEDEPNNAHDMELCVEIYVNQNKNRGRWNDEKCSSRKYPACFKAGKDPEELAQRNASLHVVPAAELIPLPQPADEFLNCSDDQQMINSTCSFNCSQDFLQLDSAKLTCTDIGVWTGQRPVCISFTQALMAVVGCGSFSTICIVCFCCICHRKRKKLAQPRDLAEVASPQTHC
ncbi:L-selectin-like [Lampris incognitus]|uniref:L-selectin-like n=1 Tax=Lampris incognitus TaxID=2546036 RepID=UPI0024B5EED5|nr:L-selectin-like [Lampris incognitus]